MPQESLRPDLRIPKRSSATSLVKAHLISGNCLAARGRKSRRARLSPAASEQWRKSCEHGPRFTGASLLQLARKLSRDLVKKGRLIPPTWLCTILRLLRFYARTRFGFALSF